MEKWMDEISHLNFYKFSDEHGNSKLIRRLWPF